MFLNAVFTQMCMTDITVHRGKGIPTQGTPQNVLGAISGVHDQTQGGLSKKYKVVVALNVHCE